MLNALRELLSQRFDLDGFSKQRLNGFWSFAPRVSRVCEESAV